MTVDAADNRSFPVMGTTAHVLAYDATPGLLDMAQARLNRLEQLWSRFLPKSELSQLNNSGGVPVVLSAETFSLVSDAIDAWALTDGAFDPTVGHTMDACGYDRPFAEMNRSAAVDQDLYRAAPGPSEIVLHPYANSIELPEGLKLDLGGIAKGAAADMVAAEMVESGAAGCLVNIGGDIATAGTAPRREGWQITLECPGSTETKDIGIAAGAVCTSTTTRRSWGEQSGAQADTEHHLRNPRTGEPLRTGLVSVTIISERAIQAEVLTKAVMAAGRERGIALAESAEATGLVVDESGTITPMSGLGAFLAAALTTEPA